MKPCPVCAQHNDDNAQSCVSCGTNLRKSISLRPVSLATRQTSRKAIASLVCGVCGLLYFFLFPAAVAAVILGHMSRSEIRRSAGRLRGSGIALTGLILGYAGVAALAMFLVSGLIHARIAADEARAVASLRTLVTACIMYNEKYLAYPKTLDNLGPSELPDAADMIDVTLRGGHKDGYVFNYVPVETHDGQVTGFRISADPIKPGWTGARHFFVDESGVIRSEMNKAATAESQLL
jgi:Domain of unknown function (DUF4190)